MHTIGMMFAAAVLASTVVRAQDFHDLPWRIAESGVLEAHLIVSDQGRDWQPMLPGLLGGVTGDAALDLGPMPRFGLLPILPLLLHGDGGAAQLDEAARRLHRLGQGAHLEVRAIMMSPRDPLDDLLRLRTVTDRGFQSSWILGNQLLETSKDPFVRAAAAGTVVRWSERYQGGADEQTAKLIPKRNNVLALQSALARCPDGMDLLLGVDGTSVTNLSSLFGAWRELGARRMATVECMAGGSLSPRQFGEAQLAMDAPGQLPFELARRFGNWRTDYSLFAFRLANGAPLWWIHLGGTFQPEQIATGLTKAGGTAVVDRAQGVKGTLAGWNVSATSTTFEAWPEQLRIETRGEHFAELHGRAATGEPPVWMWFPESSRIAAFLGHIGGPARVDLTMAPLAVSAMVDCHDAAGAKQLEARWLDWQRRYRCEGESWQFEDLPPGTREFDRDRLVLRRCIQAARCTQFEHRLTWTLDLAQFSRLDLVRLLTASPSELLSDDD